MRNDDTGLGQLFRQLRCIGRKKRYYQPHSERESGFETDSPSDYYAKAFTGCPVRNNSHAYRPTLGAGYRGYNERKRRCFSNGRRQWCGSKIRRGSTSSSVSMSTGSADASQGRLRAHPKHLTHKTPKVRNHTTSPNSPTKSVSIGRIIVRRVLSKAPLSDLRHRGSTGKRRKNSDTDYICKADSLSYHDSTPPVSPLSTSDTSISAYEQRSAWQRTADRQGRLAVRSFVANGGAWEPEDPLTLGREAPLSRVHLPYIKETDVIKVGNRQRRRKSFRRPSYRYLSEENPVLSVNGPFVGGMGGWPTLTDEQRTSSDSQHSSATQSTDSTLSKRRSRRRVRYSRHVVISLIH